MNLQIFLLIAIILIAVLVFFTIPLLLKLTKMIGSIGNLIDTTNDSIKILTKSVSETIVMAQDILKSVNEVVTSVKGFVGLIAELGGAVKGLAATVRESDSFINNIKGQLAGIVSSIKAAIGILTRIISKKGENYD